MKAISPEAVKKRDIRNRRRRLAGWDGSATPGFLWSVWGAFPSTDANR